MNEPMTQEQADELIARMYRFQKNRRRNFAKEARKATDPSYRKHQDKVARDRTLNRVSKSTLNAVENEPKSTWDAP